MESWGARGEELNHPEMAGMDVVNVFVGRWMGRAGAMAWSWKEVGVGDGRVGSEDQFWWWCCGVGWKWRRRRCSGRKTWAAAAARQEQAGRIRERGTAKGWFPRARGQDLISKLFCGDINQDAAEAPSVIEHDYLLTLVPCPSAQIKSFRDIQQPEAVVDISMDNRSGSAEVT